MKYLDASHVYIIAEAGVNHNGKRDLAFALVEAAADAGADAVKFQTFDAEKLALKDAPKADYQKKSTDASETQLEMLKKLELSKDWHRDLQKYAHSKKIEFLSTAFDHESLAFLCGLGLPFLKVPSGELTNSPLLWSFARTGKPLIVSTGMAVLSEVEEGLAVINHALNADREPHNMDEVWRYWSETKYRKSLYGHVTLLHCTSQYPTPFHEVNLKSMDTLLNAFGLDVGYSDHTLGTLIPVAAVARGAKVIEKHFTIDRSLPGPDQSVSLEPDELGLLVKEIRLLQTAMGDGCKSPQASEWDTRRAARQQLVAANNIMAGAVIRREDITTARSGYGLSPSSLWGLIGTVAARSYMAGEVIHL